MRMILAGAALLAAASGVSAQTSVHGWGVQIRQDTFDGSLSPVALMQESGDGFMKASLGVGCGNDSLVAFFNPGGAVFMQDSAQVTFRLPSGAQDLTFMATDLRGLGRQLALRGPENDQMISALREATGEAIPFRSDSKQGTFPTIGSSEILSATEALCRDGD